MVINTLKETECPIVLSPVLVEILKEISKFTHNQPIFLIVSASSQIVHLPQNYKLHSKSHT